MVFDSRTDLSEFEPKDVSGYNHPEEIFFPEIEYPPTAKEEDYEFPSITEEELRERERRNNVTL